MAVRIIGVDPKFEQQVTCKNCGTIIGYYNADLLVKKYKDISQCMCTQEYLYCPGCTNTVIIRET